MAKHNKPRCGSLAYSPRKRAKKIVPRVKSYPEVKDAKLLGFSGYKVGMVHVIARDLTKNSLTNGQDITLPATIIETPPMLIYGIRIYANTYNGENPYTDIFAENLEKRYIKRLGLKIPKISNTKEKLAEIESQLNNITKINVLASTQPEKSGINKHKGDIMEIAVGGTIEEQFAYCKNILGKELKISDVFSDGMFIDVIAVTKGKGTQGPVKRWGIKIQKRKHSRGSHARHVGCIGAWTPSNTRWMVPQAGQTGYHTRTEFNKLILAIRENGKEATPAGGFLSYGVLHGDYILLKGSVPGTKKRCIRLRMAMRAHKEEKYVIEKLEI